MFFGVSMAKRQKQTENEIAKTFLYVADDWHIILDEFRKIMSKWKILLVNSLK